MKMYNHYAYPEMERELDAYLLQAKHSPAVGNAYRTVKWQIYGNAFYDYSVGQSYTEEQALSFAWEDFEIALTGHRMGPVTYALIGLWNELPKEEHNNFEVVLENARMKAAAATSEEVQRRYVPLFTSKPVRRPEQGFTLPEVLSQFRPRPGENFSLFQLDKEEERRWLEVTRDRVVKSTHN